jgi:hypothetical protein
MQERQVRVLEEPVNAFGHVVAHLASEVNGCGSSNAGGLERVRTTSVDDLLDRQGDGRIGLCSECLLPEIADEVQARTAAVLEEARSLVEETLAAPDVFRRGHLVEKAQVRLEGCLSRGLLAETQRDEVAGLLERLKQSHLELMRSPKDQCDLIRACALEAVPAVVDDLGGVLGDTYRALAAPARDLLVETTEVVIVKYLEFSAIQDVPVLALGFESWALGEDLHVLPRAAYACANRVQYFDEAVLVPARPSAAVLETLEVLFREGEGDLHEAYEAALELTS